MAEIAPIPTRYAGRHFRSRTEARWAVYFDAMGIQYEYEKEGYDLGALGYYLPDFWLPQVGMWAEVKGESFNEAEIEKCAALSSLTARPCLMLDGPPASRNYYATSRDDCQGYMDYILDSEYLDKGRFYNSFLQDYPNTQAVGNSSVTNAVARALSARFEHGESPA